MVIIDAINHSKSLIKALRAAIHTHSITMEAETGKKICTRGSNTQPIQTQVSQTIHKTLNYLPCTLAYPVDVLHRYDNLRA